jgi:hypothetical protein
MKNKKEYILVDTETRIPIKSNGEEIKFETYALADEYRQALQKKGFPNKIDVLPRIGF